MLWPTRPRNTLHAQPAMLLAPRTFTRSQTPPKSATSCAAATNAARAAELSAGGDPNAGTALIGEASRRAPPILIDVLSRYPLAPAGKSRVARLMKMLDTSLRSPR